VLIFIFLYAGLSGAWNIVGGYGGQFSLGNAAFFGIGAYCSTLLYLNLGVSPWLGMLVGAILAVIISVLIFYPCFKLKGVFFALATLAFGEVINQVSIYWRSLTRGSLGVMIPFEPALGNFLFETKYPYYYISLIFMVLVMSLSYWIENSKTGYFLMAIREDEDAAEALAINTSRYKLVALLMSASLTSIGGTIYAQYLTFIEPDAVFSLQGVSIQVVIISVIGGIGTFLGPGLGAFLLIPLGEFLKDMFGRQLPGLNVIIYGILVIIIVIKLPKGLSSFINTWMKKQGNPDA